MGASNSTLRKLLKYGMVKLNGKVEKNGSTRVTSGSQIEVDKKAKDDRKQVKAPFKLIWEDSHLLVIDKEAGVLSSGEGITKRPTLHKLADEYVKDTSNGKQRAFIVHRLDKEVGGLILFAKSEEVQQKLKESWHLFTKKYLALCHSKPQPEVGTIDTWLIERKQTMKVVPTNSQDAVKAVSHYKFLREEGDYFLVEVKLQTGKKNQIRVHLAHIGSPIVGDRKYGIETDVDRDVRLLSYYLEIQHPITGEVLKWELTPPKRFLEV